MKKALNNEPSLYKVPPQSIEAEESLLSAILIQNENLIAVRDILDPEDFYRSAHQKIFSAILKLANQRTPIDLVTTVNCLKTNGQLEEIGGAFYLAQLVDSVPMAVNARHYAKIIKKCSTKRRIIEGTNSLVKKAFEPASEIDELLADILEMQSKIMRNSAAGNGAIKLKMTTEDLQSYFSSLRETPFNSLNQVIEGLMVGELTIIGGRPGMGKTALALEFLSHTAIDEGSPVIYCGAQMSKPRIYARLLAQRCKINLRKILGGRVPEEKQKQLLENHRLINQASIETIIIKNRISVPDLMAQVLRALDRTKEKLGLLIIENLQQLIWPGKTFERDWEQVSFMVEKLRPFCYEIGTPIIASSQLNRKLEDREDKRPLLSDLFGKAGEDLADNVFFPFRPNVYDKSIIKEEGRPEKDAEISISKGGAPVRLPFVFWGDYLSWEEIE
ncbi:AAA family ATPase [Patescibacteria group bacterium]|nr:AAA family ATPase [Patescibacteria group bacterium]MBU4082352.1 AAA family ATPase [Patescibacteria group bacterium]MCG2809762.1 AAA family ATPase [Candidatus Portnoybacteria bacterium]